MSLLVGRFATNDNDIRHATARADGERENLRVRVVLSADDIRSKETREELEAVSTYIRRI